MVRVAVRDLQLVKEGQEELEEHEIGRTSTGSSEFCNGKSYLTLQDSLLTTGHAGGLFQQYSCFYA